MSRTLELPEDVYAALRGVAEASPDHAGRLDRRELAEKVVNKAGLCRRSYAAVQRSGEEDSLNVPVTRRRRRAFPLKESAPAGWGV
jgi:hypothetical protein